ncbi:MAG: SH3 domain-containing protein [Dongiaceae bacterium]
MASGTVTASSLNLRAEPGGAIVTALPFGARLTIEAEDGEWLKVSQGALSGYVAARFVSREDGPPAAVPPRDPGTIREDAQGAYTPAGQRFVSRSAAGFVTRGKTTVRDFLATPGAAGLAVAPSGQRVLQAVLANEGCMEAVNSYDNSFMSFGMLQWTAGADGSPGELGALLARLKRDDAAAFDEYFGSFGLDTEAGAGAAAGATGHLSLAGSRLDSAAAKAVLRSGLWAYRFWRAGHADPMRRCQIGHGAGRIELVRRLPVAQATAADYVTSELGIALLLDQHVNRPAHVRGTLGQAVSDLLAEGASPAPAGWTTETEARLLTLYLARRAATSMTHSEARAAAIRQSGLVSAARGSFQP